MSSSWVLAGYVAAIGLWFGAIFEGMLFLRLPRPGAQILCGLILALGTALVFCAGLMLKEASGKEETDQIISWVSNVSPVVVVATILAQDVAHSWPALYATHLPDYGKAEADVALVFEVLLISTVLLLVITRLVPVLLRKSPAPSKPVAQGEPQAAK